MGPNLSELIMNVLKSFHFCWPLTILHENDAILTRIKEIQFVSVIQKHNYKNMIYLTWTFNCIWLPDFHLLAMFQNAIS